MDHDKKRYHESLDQNIKTYASILYVLCIRYKVNIKFLIVLVLVTKIKAMHPFLLRIRLTICAKSNLR